MEIWQMAKTFADEAAKRTQTLASPAKIADIVSDTAKLSKELAAEASKKANEIRAVALHQADQHIKSLADQIPSSLSLLNSPSQSQSQPHSSFELEKLGITDDLRQFVRGLTLSTFQNFPVQDESQISDVPTVSNVRQDLSEWQQKHASLVLITVKEISRLRYELCPRHMKDGKFWRIYFTLVSTHVAPYEKKYMEEIKQKEVDEIKDDKQTLILDDAPKPGAILTNQKSITSTSSTAEQDLDSFLLGDLEDGDVGPGGADGADFASDDDFDKIDNLAVEDEKLL